MATLLKDGHPIARKEHQCPWCAHVIKPGEKYYRQTVAYDGSVYDNISCEECNEIFGFLWEYWELEDLTGSEEFMERIWDVLGDFMSKEEIRKLNNHEQVLEVLKHKEEIIEADQKFRNKYGYWCRYN